ncbi:2-mannosyltransferase homolog 4 [Durusdinium trenchii]|uniref:2-mannosyltransferase homolog 4 n=1 Tax=Durusdinium trenchii TaxID=1381693 RepID=A0ABP0MTM6_9DINO
MPHCSGDDYANAFWWEGVASASSEGWLEEVLGRLKEATRVAAALRPAPYYMLTEETCDVSADIPLLHDPSRCLQDIGGWDVITMISDLENVTSIGSEQGRIVESPGNDTFRLEFDSGGKVTSKKYGKVILSPKQGGGITVTPKNADLVVVSPQAGNCFDMADMIPPVRGNAYVLVVPINPLYAPPTRIIPNYERIRFELHFVAEDMTDTHKLQRLLFLAHCSLQSAVDLLSPRYTLLFVHGARAIFVERSLAHHFCSLDESGDACASVEEIWHRGAGCVSSTLHLMKSGLDILEEAKVLVDAEWPCKDYLSLDLPQMPLEQLVKKLPASKRHLYDDPMCRTQGSLSRHEVTDPASWPHLPGRQHAIADRGHCLIEEGLCECYPPWRGELCEQLEPGVDTDRAEGVTVGGTVIVTMASRARLHELHFGLSNWWEKFNHRFDHPVLVFHQGLSPREVAEIRQSSRNRVWFANVDRFFRKPEALPTGPGRLMEATVPEGYRLMCRFKATFVLDQPALQGFDWMLWLDSDSYFTGDVEEDFAARMIEQQAIFGYTHVGREDAPVIKNLFDVALLFEAAELGGSKDRPPAAMSLDEGGVLNQDRAFEEGFSETAQNTYFERILSVNSPLERGHVLPFSSPAWKGHVPLTDMMILHISSFRTDALRRFTDWIDEWGGWWLYRWGDAAIRAVQVWLMLEARECYEFSDLAYAHQHFCRCAREIDAPCTFLGRGAKIFRWSCEKKPEARSVWRLYGIYDLWMPMGI